MNGDSLTHIRFAAPFPHIPPIRAVPPTNASGAESRKLGKESIETEEVNQGWGSGDGTHTVVQEVDSSDTTSIVEVDSGDTTTIVEPYVDSSSADSIIVMTGGSGGSGQSGGSGGSKSGTTTMFVGSKVRGKITVIIDFCPFLS